MSDLVVEHGAPFTDDHGFWMDITVPAAQLCNASAAAYRHKGLLVDVTFAAQ